jgi:Domain of unknown function (DUF932)
MVKATATLIAGKATTMDLAGLKRLPAPEVLGTRHKPIPHYELVTTIHERLAQRDYKVAAEEFAVQRRNGAMLYGTVVLEKGEVAGLARDGQGFALGIRAANDGKCQIQLAAGVRVFVCSNGAFSADCIMLKRKHMLSLDIVGAIDAGLDAYANRMKTFIAQQDRARTLKLPDDKAKVLIYNVFVEGFMPQRSLPAVHENYFAPTPDMTDCAGRTLWALHNAFTREVRTMPPAPAFRATTHLGRLLAGAGLN